MTNMNATELLRSVDHAAAMNDRWLFLASLMLLGLFGVWVVRYFVKQHERLLDDHKQSRECYQESLRGVRSEERRVGKECRAQSWDDTREKNDRERTSD